MKSTLFLLMLVWLPAILPGQAQTDADSYTRYELLDPATRSFRIIYDVSATTPGAQYYFNTLRKGSEHKVDAVYDRMTGEPLKWEIVSGKDLRQSGFSQADEETDYLKVFLARPVPENGEVRIRIDKTYQDPASYFEKDGRIVFSRSLSIPRNAVVLPKGYELTGCNYPSQVVTETDGRIRVSFMNRGPGSVRYEVTARPLPTGYTATTTTVSSDPLPWENIPAQPDGRDKSKARLNYSFSERAFQDREIVYFLQQPETHSFRLYHDYTEIREGMDRYLNVVRAGSKASDPEAFMLDTGEKLNVETLRGTQITAKGIDIGQEVTPETEVVVIWYPPVKKGHSTRLRIWETYTDPNRYLVYNGELIWDRAFGRPVNTVILPEGWHLTTCSIPAIVDLYEDGRVRLYFENDRPDEIDVYLKARRRSR